MGYKHCKMYKVSKRKRHLDKNEKIIYFRDRL